MRLDYISCALTIGSTVLIGKRYWQGWVVAAANSVIICFIGFRTEQTGFIPANLFCLGIYGYNIIRWRSLPNPSQPVASSDRLMRQDARHRGTPDRPARRNRPSKRNAPARGRDRIRTRELPARG